MAKYSTSYKGSLNFQYLNFFSEKEFIENNIELKTEADIEKKR